jgi:hypothetical protein
MSTRVTGVVSASTDEVEAFVSSKGAFVMVDDVFSTAAVWLAEVTDEDVERGLTTVAAGAASTLTKFSAACNGGRGVGGRCGTPEVKNTGSLDGVDVDSDSLVDLLGEGTGIGIGMEDKADGEGGDGGLGAVKGEEGGAGNGIAPGVGRLMGVVGRAAKEDRRGRRSGVGIGND